MRNILFATITIVILLCSCVKDEQYSGPAVIENITFNPSAPKANQAITVTCKITDLKSVTAAVVKYKINTGSVLSVPMTAGSLRVPLRPRNSMRLPVMVRVSASVLKKATLSGNSIL